MLSSVRLSDCQLRKFGYDTEFMCHPRFGCASPMATSSSGFLYGKGRNSIARTQLKIVTFTPMPSVRHSTAAMVNPGLLVRVRMAKRMSWSIGAPIESDGGSRLGPPTARAKQKGEQQPDPTVDGRRRLECPRLSNVESRVSRFEIRDSSSY